MNATTMIPLRCISINQAEGETANLTKCGCQTWEAANGHLLKIRAKAPKDGSYYKTDVVVTWADGMSVDVREDVADDGSYTPNLSGRIRQLWLFYGGLSKPDHFTEEKYEEFTSDKARRDAAIKCLSTYSLEDAAATPKPVEKVAPIWPSKAEFMQAVDMVGKLIQRVESAQAKNEKDAATIRTTSLELRKALAAIIRTGGAS